MHKPRKRFGQHFLKDHSIIQGMVNAIHPQPGQVIIEIGPGTGALTLPLLQAIQDLTVIELDRDVIPLLEKKCRDYGQLHIHQGDVLNFNFLNYAKNQNKPLRLVGNLPYNISTPLLFHLIEHRKAIQDMHFMLQREVAERLAANKGSSAYGRLTIMVQYHFDIEFLYQVPPSAFEPPPRVYSAIINLKPHQNRYEKILHWGAFSDIVRDAFQQRRKMLRNSLAKYVSEIQLTQLNISPTLRPEELSLDEYIKIANYYAKWRNI